MSGSFRCRIFHFLSYIVSGRGESKCFAYGMSAAGEIRISSECDGRFYGCGALGQWCAGSQTVRVRLAQPEVRNAGLQGEKAQPQPGISEGNQHPTSLDLSGQRQEQAFRFVAVHRVCNHAPEWCHRVWTVAVSCTTTGKIYPSIFCDEGQPLSGLLEAVEQAKGSG